MFGDTNITSVALDWLVGILLWKLVDLVWELVRNKIRMAYIRKTYGT